MHSGTVAENGVAASGVFWTDSRTVVGIAPQVELTFEGWNGTNDTTSTLS
jgi:hypothetical protein